MVRAVVAVLVFIAMLASASPPGPDHDRHCAKLPEPGHPGRTLTRMSDYGIT
ncbi:hypothetical protein GCM10010390_73860 [Streptomyces mordarskii]|uniref:Uncharacterized protein n=1 Tax=Streptomyces mordarskii TaxID=1226758 RepID=A0ABN1E7R7_9ACTN